MEIKIVKFFNRLGGERWDKLMDVVSRVKFLVIFWAIVLLGFFIFDKVSGEKIILAILIALVAHFLISELLIKITFSKIFSKRKRPYIAFDKEIRPIGRKFTDSSFPSSHMTTLLAVLSVIISYYPNFLFVAIFLVLLTAYARMHNGMHYLSDVLAGIILPANAYSNARLDFQKLKKKDFYAN